MKPSELHAIAPTLTEPRLSEYAKLLSDELYKAGIIDTKEIAAFISQAAHESTDFSRLSENLYYSDAKRIVKVWPSRFADEAAALPYTRNPVKLANRVYSNRYGNGPEESGDGWKYRGRGLFQLTFLKNYLACGEWMGVDLVNNPDKLLQIGPATGSAIWFWKVNKLSGVLRDSGITAVSKIINGGDIGMKERVAGYDVALKALFA